MEIQDMSRTILAVDDSEDERTLLAFTLRLSGYQVIEAVNGADAIEKLHLHKVGMVITDLNMPNLNGIGLIRGIRQNDTWCNIPVIVLSGDPRESRKQEANEAGATGWIIKPVQVKQLLSVIENVLENCQKNLASPSRIFSSIS
jgi:two-component system chemotaxis response regulator CheY